MNQRELNLAIDGFDPIAYWSTRDVKIWLVEVTRTGSLKHMMYVRSRTREGAEQTARENTFIKGKVSARARLATPRDLGCVRTK